MFEVTLWKTMPWGTQELSIEVEATKETAFQEAVKVMQEGGNPLEVTEQWGGKIRQI
jgi:hypothetical protein